MQFGVNILSRGPMGSRDGYITVATAAERLGFGFVSVNDHVVVPGDIASRYPYSEEGDWAGASAGQCLEQLSALNFLAGCTQRVGLLTSVMVVPHRAAILAAKMIATADVLSNGRVILGCGAGWMKEEIELLGSNYPERGRVTDEYIAAFRELWSKPRPTYKGKHVAFENVLFEPKPVQKPGVPIWIGGESKAAIERAVRLGDGWYPGSSNPANRLDTTERVVAAMNGFKSKVASAGRDPAKITLAHVVLWPVAFEAEKAISGGRRSFTGTTAELIADAKALAGAGVSHVNLSFHATDVPGIVARMEKFAGEVMGKVG
jgi:probable F420-dependent oxidoreductase